MAGVPQIESNQERRRLAEPAGKAFGYSRQRYLRYLLWALPIPVFAWALAFVLVCSPSYERWGRTEWGPVLEFPYQASAPDADVVIFGDSSAFLGIDPRLLNVQLGIRSVVLPSTVGSLPVIGDAPLRSYLAHHPAPRVIVLYFSPWNLDFGQTAPGRMFEGEEMMFRHGTSPELLRFFSRHPLELLAFPMRLYSSFGAQMLLGVLHHSSRNANALASLGHAPFDEPYPTLDNLCRLPEAYLRTASFRSVEELQRRYAQPGTQVMVYLAPIPDCTNSGSLTLRSFAGVGAAPPLAMPATDFASDTHYAHVWPFAVPVATNLLGKAMQQKPGLLPEAGGAAALESAAPPAAADRPEEAAQPQNDLAPR